MKLIEACVLGFLVLAIAWTLHFAIEYENEGEEKAALILYLKGYDIHPEQAKHIQFTNTDFDIALSIDQFTVIGAD